MQNEIEWTYVYDSLPNVGRNILAKGYYELDFDDYYEEGFRSTEDKVEDMKKGLFLDFSFNVRCWVYCKLLESSGDI